jgi:hypothetical protein
MSCYVCESFAATGICPITGKYLCGTTCQRNLYNFIGNKDDLESEKIQRMRVNPNNLPFTILVGPHMYHRVNYKDIDIWFFGEQHYLNETEDLKNRLKLDVRKKLTFSGTNYKMMDTSRFLYAVAASAKRNERQTDIFVELPYDAQKYYKRNKLEKDETMEDLSIYSPDENLPTLVTMRKLINDMKCGEMVRELESECETYPMARFHYVDYRPAKTGFSFEHIIADMMEKTLYTKDNLIIQRFALILEQNNVFKSYRHLYLTSNTFSSDFVNLLAPFVKPLLGIPIIKDLVELLTEETIIVKLLKNDMTNARKQLFVLEKEDLNLAKKLIEYFELHVENDIYKYFRVKFDSFKMLFETTVWIMDVTLLGRLFRNLNVFSKLKIVYTGAWHTQNYIRFMGFLLKNKLSKSISYEEEEEKRDIIEFTNEQDVKKINEYIE